MARYEDLMEFKNDTERMNVVRERISKVCYNALMAECGEDFVRFIPEDIGITPNASKVAKNTVVADVGDVLDKDKFPVGVCVEVTVKVKKWNTVTTKSNKVTYGVSLDDYDESLKAKAERKKEG
jgi:hypothetical protein